MGNQIQAMCQEFYYIIMQAVNSLISLSFFKETTANRKLDTEVWLKIT